MRAPIVSGQFYLNEPSPLRRQIESCFFHKFGPGSMPKAAVKNKPIRSFIVPHAGYQYSGPCAAHVYKALVETEKKDLPEIFIMFGPNHSGYSKTSFSISLEAFETPLGVIDNNREIGQALIEEASMLGLQEDNLAHKFEHSIEVQLPFLQFVYSLIKKKFSIVPIVISSINYQNAKQISEKIFKVIIEKNLKNKVCILASSDFTHYGFNYGFIPFTKNIKENLYSLDKRIIQAILKRDSKTFYNEATKTTICGVIPILLAIELAIKFNIKEGALLKYYTSGDILQDYSSSVGYAGIVFR